MLRWMCAISLQDRVATKDLLERLKLRSIEEEIRVTRPRWYGHEVRKGIDDWVKKTWKIKVKGPRGRPKKTWEETVTADCRSLVFSRKMTLWTGILGGSA